jgi:hypothetical protein
MGDYKEYFLEWFCNNKVRLWLIQQKGERNGQTTSFEDHGAEEDEREGGVRQTSAGRV